MCDVVEHFHQFPSSPSPPPPSSSPCERDLVTVLMVCLRTGPSRFRHHVYNKHWRTQDVLVARQTLDEPRRPCDMTNTGGTKTSL